MGLLFNGTTQCLSIASAPVTAVPLSIAFWMKPVAVSGQYYYVSICSTTASDFDLFAVGSGSATQLQAETSNTASNIDIVAFSSVTLAIGTIYHICGVWTTTTNFQCYANGGNSSGAQTTSCIPTAGNLNKTAIGAVFSGGTSPSVFASGNIYFPAIWNVALSTADITSLANGISPRKIRPDKLLRYPRLTGHLATEPDLRNSVGWTVTAAPAEAPNVRIYFP